MSTLPIQDEDGEDLCNCQVSLPCLNCDLTRVPDCFHPVHHLRDLTTAHILTVHAITCSVCANDSDALTTPLQFTLGYAALILLTNTRLHLKRGKVFVGTRT